MHPSFYQGSGAIPLSPTHQMMSLRNNSNNNPNHANLGQSNGMGRPPYLQVDVSPFVGIPQGSHLPSPTSFIAPPPPTPYLMQQYQFSAQNSPVSSNGGLGMVGRPPPVFTGANDTLINDQTLRSLQERVAQIASIKRLSAQELASMNSQHITPRNIGVDGNRMLMQEVTHLNPPGGARAPYATTGSKVLHSASSSASLTDLLQGRMTPSERSNNHRLSLPSTPSGSPPTMLLPMPPPPIKTASSPSSSSSRLIGPTEEELRKLNELMPTGDDPDSKKSVEEWKKFRLRVMSRLRKQRWRAKKKAEVLAGIEDTQKEEAERKRRDRLRKQEQRARKKLKAMEETSSGQSSDGVDSRSNSNADGSPTSSVEESSGD